MKRKMTALLIGNADYAHCHKLTNPVNDATDVAAKLKGYGFNVILVSDASYVEMDRSLKQFKGQIEEDGVALFFFAGHGIQIDEANYLLAVDTGMRDEVDAKHGSLSLDKVLDLMDKSPAITKIVILDACRQNPWKKGWSRAAAARGLASVYAPKGTIIGYATSPGQVALDGKGRNGTYSSALLQHIDAIDCPIETIFKRVRNTVAAETKGKQISWEHTSLSGEFYFNTSIGRIITEYGASALADGLFVIDAAKLSSKIIRGLKTHNYYAQNDALDLLTEKSVLKINTDNLFVIGRNIYQAACGGANSAVPYAESFVNATAGFPDDKRKAILDGMLFEIFFDREGKLRSEIKDRYFEDLFELQKHKELNDSFVLISEALVASRGAFYVVPGKGLELAVTVATRKVGEAYRVEEVYVDGADVLQVEDKEYEEKNPDDRMYVSRSVEGMSEQLSREMMVPPRAFCI